MLALIDLPSPGTPSLLICVSFILVHGLLPTFGTPVSILLIFTNVSLYPGIQRTIISWMNEWNQEKLAHDRISEATVHGKGSNLRSQRIASTELMLFVSPVPPQSPWLSLVTSTLPTMPAWAEWCSFLVSNCSWVSAHTGCKTTNLLLFP